MYAPVRPRCRHGRKHGGYTIHCCSICSATYVRQGNSTFVMPTNYLVICACPTYPQGAQSGRTRWKHKF